MSAADQPADLRTAEAFAASRNHLPEGSVYTAEQFRDWLDPLNRADVEGKTVLELGCGGGSMLVHLAGWAPAHLVGVDLGASVEAAEHNLAQSIQAGVTTIERADLTTYRSPERFDLVVCIGVLHHLQDPDAGIDAVLANVTPGGRFHCWVYAHEGNALIRWVVDPIRRVASRLPWWVTKYLIATPLAVPYYLYAKTIAAVRSPVVDRLPLAEYSRWIARRDFAFFRHVAFDQLVTPRTVYLRRSTVERWLADPRVEPGSTYLVFRNGNSWKFGGRVSAEHR